jgi:hypothetical protein
MKKVDLRFELVNLQGKKLDTAGNLVANFLMSSMSKTDSVKYFDWAITFSKNKIVEMDDSDFVKFKNLIKDSENIVVMAKSPIIKYLEGIK